jgi:hypothetical protein
VKKFLVTIVTLVLGVGLVAGVAAWQIKRGEAPPPIEVISKGTLDTPQGQLPHYELKLDVYPNSSPAVAPPKEPLLLADALSGQPFYNPSTTIRVPANSAITIKFRQFDSGGQIYNPFFAKVHGTMDGTMKVNGKSVTEIDSNSVGHTFTVHQYPETGQPNLFLSVPLPMVPSSVKTDANGYPVTPQEISVTFITGDAGTYVWNCEFPCGDLYQEFGGPMQTRGWMAGTFEVV